MKRYRELLEKAIDLLNYQLQESIELAENIAEELSNTEHEPVGYIHIDNSWCGQGEVSVQLNESGYELQDGTKLYTSPPQQNPLSDEEKKDIAMNHFYKYDTTLNDIIDAINDAEKYQKIGN